MITLGLNAAFHDSAAVLVIDGVPVAAAEEEPTRYFDAGALPPSAGPSVLAGGCASRDIRSSR